MTQMTDLIENSRGIVEVYLFGSSLITELSEMNSSKKFVKNR